MDGIIPSINGAILPGASVDTALVPSTHFSQSKPRAAVAASSLANEYDTAMAELDTCRQLTRRMNKLLVRGFQSAEESNSFVATMINMHERLSTVKSVFKGKTLLHCRFESYHGRWRETVLLDKETFEALVWFTCVKRPDYTFHLPDFAFNGKLINTHVRWNQIYQWSTSSMDDMLQHCMEKQVWRHGLIMDAIQQDDMVRHYREWKHQRGIRRDPFPTRLDVI